MAISSAVSICSWFMWVIYFVNGAQSLNATSIFLSPSVTVISPVTRIYASK